jgi:hypothetical protein
VHKTDQTNLNFLKYVGCGTAAAKCNITRCPALNVNKVKHCISSTVKCIGEIDTFSNTGPHEVPYVLSGSQYRHY